MDDDAMRLTLDTIGNVLEALFESAPGVSYAVLIGEAKGERSHVHTVTNIPPDEAMLLFMAGAERMMLAAQAEAQPGEPN
jgi:hypothetical protein